MSGPLVHSPAEIVSRLLVALGHAADPDGFPWAFFIGDEPEEPDEVVTTYNTLGRSDGRAMRTGRRYQHYGFQVRVRGAEEDRIYEKIHRIYISLDEEVTNSELDAGSQRYLIPCISAMKTPVSLGKLKDSNLRAYTLNGLVSVSLIDPGED